MRLARVLLVFASGLVAFANSPLPDNSTYLGLARYIQVNSYVAAADSGGGQFSGTVSTDQAAFNANSRFATNFWCVDDQETLFFGQQGFANVIRLDNVNAAPYNGKVRFDGVTNAGSPQWTIKQDLDGDPLPSLARDRYKMAAYLIQQYGGFNNTINASVENNAIQRAIWTITNNNSLTGGIVGLEGGTNADKTKVQYWVNQALLNYQSGVDATKWAVVSWAVSSPDGNLLPGSQTLLVQVVPEPGFYGVLALGISGLYLMVRRKRGMEG